MKHAFLLLAFVGLAACSKPSIETALERPAENGAQYKDREGVALTDIMKKSIGLQIAEVEEAKVVPRFTVPLHVLSGAGGSQKSEVSSGRRIASGWLTTAEAAHVKAGTRVSLQAPEGPADAVVTLVEKSPYHVAGEFE